MKYLEYTFATNVYSHCNMCNTSIYFCNIHKKHLQHTAETTEILETYAPSVHFLSKMNRGGDRDFDLKRI
jgi:hypothetical protein